jgi:hypothetical protein
VVGLALLLQVLRVRRCGSASIGEPGLPFAVANRGIRKFEMEETRGGSKLQRGLTGTIIYSSD